MKLKKEFTLGSDPEFFVAKTGTVIAAPELISDEFYDEGQFQFFADNALIEFNTSPALDREQFIAYNSEAMNFLTKYLLETHSAVITTKVDHTFESNQLKNSLCKEFGCEPDMNAYTRKLNPKPDISKVGNYRVAGGHIHIGYEGENEETSILLIKNLDATLGCFCVLNEGENNRRIQYGKAGSYRRAEGIKVEYRSPSNFWIHNPELMGIVYDIVSYALHMTIDKGINLEDDRIEHSINHRDLETCQEIMNESIIDKNLLKCLNQTKWKLNSQKVAV